MSTASNPKQTTEQRSGQYAKFDEYVDYQVSKTGSNIKANDLLTTAVGITAIFLGYLLVFVLFDHWIIKGGFGHTARLLMLAGVFLACLGWAVWKLILPYFKKVTHLYSAQALEQTSAEMEGSLLNLIDLKNSNRTVNPEIINSLEKRAALTLSQTDTEQAVDRRPLMRLSYILLFVVALLCFYALFSPKEIWPSISAAISFSPQREFATQTQINSVTPGNTEVLSGSQLEVIVDLRGEVPETVTLFYSSSDEGRVDEPVKLRAMDETLKRYQGMIVGINGRGIRQELTYHVQAGDAISEEFRVKVIQPPSATVHSIRYEYPKYMELAAVEQPGGAIDAWEGTKITVDATTNMPIASFEVLFSDDEDSNSLLEEFRTEKKISKNSITASWKLKLRADGTFPKFYQIKCRNEAGQTTLSPTVYPLMIRPDQPPEISLLTPKQDLTMPANGIVPISVIAEDPDFKIRYVNLRVDKQQVRILDKTLFEGSEQSVGLNHDFELGPLRLTPGETIYFWVEARDNKHPSGNRQNTPKIKIEITEPVSEEEAQKQLEEQKQKTAPQNPNPDSDQKNKSEPMENKSDKTDQKSSDQPDPDKKEEGQPGKETKPGDENQQEKNDQKTGNKKSQQSESTDPQQSEEPGAGQKPKKSGEKQELDSNGADDQEAMKRILEQLKKEGQKPEPGSEPKQKPDSEKQEPGKSENDPQMQDQKSSGSSSEKNNPSSDTGKGSEGTPQDSPEKNSNPQSSDQADKPDNDPSGKQKPSQTGPVPEGKKEPAAPSDDAMKSKSNGDPKGKATPNNDPDADPRKTDKNVERDPNQKPATRPGQNDSSQKPKSNHPDSKSENTDNASKTDPKQGMRKPEKSDQNQSPSGKQQPSSNPDSKQKPDQPDGSNEPPQDKGRPTDQKSKQPQNGEKGNSSQNDQGQKGSQQPGKGDSSGQKGNQEQNSKNQPADSKQSKNKPDSNSKSNEKSSGQNKSGQNKSGESKSGKKSGNQPGGNKSGSPGKGQSKSKGGQSAGSSSGQRAGDPQGSGSTKGGQSAAADDQDSGNASPPGLPEAEDANLEYGKEAANLVLKRIKDELKRKEVNQELLKELGWTKEEMQQFSERLQKQLQTPEQELQSPASLARKRQFEEMLKSLKPANRAAQRERTSTRKQNTDSIGPRRLPVPEEYREAYEAFTRGLAEKKTSDK
ncbi:hypothetical protein [Gimesia algae]|uniref:Immunoglobulin G-binding protein A n=1 Tax=Gimesia algae TaxID=2527971 RepID=A0A517V8P5_9PLAN|nr:hypothetical protein [Gimesia algae]QDT89374.1 hypothetical protein Pan161_10030 [Gimesia algae]